MTRMTQAEFAKRRGVGKSAVSNWKKAGLVVLAEGEGGKMLVDVERTEARLNARLDPMRGRPTSNEAVDAPALPLVDEAATVNGVGRNLAQARAELVDEDLFGRRLKNAQSAGELVAAVEAERKMAGLGRMLRERLAGGERGVAERLAATSDVRAVMSILDEVRDQVFAALAAAVMGGELDEPDVEEAPASNDVAEAA